MGGCFGPVGCFGGGCGECVCDCVTAVKHDVHCPPGIKPDPEKCPTCMTFRMVRKEEQQALFDLAERAYARGREDAAVAVREFPVHSIPFLPSDTPLSMSVRVKQILSIAAMGVSGPDDSPADQAGF